MPEGESGIAREVGLASSLIAAWRKATSAWKGKGF